MFWRSSCCLVSWIEAQIGVRGWGDQWWLIVPYVVPWCCFWEHVREHFQNFGNPLESLMRFYGNSMGAFWKLDENIFGISKPEKFIKIHKLTLELYWRISPRGTLNVILVTYMCQTTIFGVLGFRFMFSSTLLLLLLILTYFLPSKFNTL
jgi:hypothetical protein